jgi:hypothetical protein
MEELRAGNGDLAYVVVGSFSVSRHPSGANEVFTYSYRSSEKVEFQRT